MKSAYIYEICIVCVKEKEISKMNGMNDGCSWMMEWKMNAVTGNWTLLKKINLSGAIFVVPHPHTKSNIVIS